MLFLQGENVATTEVAQVMGAFENGLEVNVYGVDVPHQDGKVEEIISPLCVFFLF